MKVIYEALYSGELPFRHFAKSKQVHTWVPRKGWVQSEGFPRKKWRGPGASPIRMYNEYIPLSAIRMRDIRRWIKQRADKLDVNRGQFVALIQNIDWNEEDEEPSVTIMGTTTTLPKHRLGPNDYINIALCHDKRYGTHGPPPPAYRRYFPTRT
jgi:hypothetical protein